MREGWGFGSGWLFNECGSLCTLSALGHGGTQRVLAVAEGTGWRALGFWLIELTPKPQGNHSLVQGIPARSLSP